MATQHPVDHTAVTQEQLVEELRRLLHRGLPATEDTAGAVLLNLKSVFARAVHPRERLSRLDALNALLPRLLDKLEDETYREATRNLFGVAAGTRGTTLTARRRQAAAVLNYNVDHFRSRIENELVTALAEEVLRDLLRYGSRIKRAAESMEPTGDTPRLDPEDLTAEEELVSRIWQHVYGLRAEMIAHLRIVQHAGYEGQAEDHRQAVLRQEATLRKLVREYTETYGKALIRHGEAEYAVEGLERLAGWKR